MSDRDILTFDPQDRTLQGKRGVVLGVANRQSIAYGGAVAFRFLRAELALADLGDEAKPHVQPIAEELEAPVFPPCNVEHELRLKGIRAHAISPEPIRTRAASGINDFEELLSVAETRAPSAGLVSIKDVGIATAALAMPGAHLITGNTICTDGGYNVMG